MRGYGLPRNDDVANPDCADRRFYGLKGGRMKNRKQNRRIWKKLARRLNRQSEKLDGESDHVPQA
jgi:hypothetical protein